MEAVSDGKNTLKEILTSFEKERENLIPVLQKINQQYGFISKKHITETAKYFDISSNEVYGVASFYKQFKFIKPGKFVITVCMGTACFVSGGNILLDAVIEHLGVHPGETTENGLFSLEQVSCLGCCALAPVVKINDEVFAKMTPAKLKRKIDRIKKNESVE